MKIIGVGSQGLGTELQNFRVGGGEKLKLDIVQKNEDIER